MARMDELIREVRAATRARARTRQADEAAGLRLAAAVRAAMAGKVPVPDLVKITGLSRERLYQLKAGRRTLAKES
jgi:hypothetical protein